MKIDYELLAKKATAVKENSYSPYSNYKVGCALLTKGGKIYTGVNVENAIYKSTCAEVSALNTAVTAGEREFVALAVSGGDGESYVLPCGVCRQILYEFNPEMEIVSVINNGKYEIKILKDLLPHAFTIKK